MASVAVAVATGALTAATGGAALPVMLAAGGIAGAGEAMMQTIDAITKRIDRDPETRALRAEIVDAVSASVGTFPVESAKQGVDLAAWIVSVRGLTTEQIAHLGFDATRAANMVLSESRHRDPGWYSGESVYQAAEAAIRATYRVLTAALREQEKVLLPVLNDLRDDLSELMGRIQDKVETIDHNTRATKKAVEEQCAQASVEDVLQYLRRRIDDWDRSEWISLEQNRRPSRVERRLNLAPRGGAGEELSVAEALERHEHLVILGGPGSGKSWLARRIARKAAATAYAQLVRGASLQEVEIPLLTTFGTWTKLQPGDARETLITASCAASLGISDLGTSVMKRLHTTLGGHSRVLVVIDALDEASDQSLVPNLVTSLLGISGWRTVVTGRPGSWDGKGALRQRQEGVADLRPISWDDVTAFVRSWFDPNTATAEALLARLKRDVRLADSATVPLLLTFYCLYAEDAPAEEPLPVLRRDLYNHVINKLIQGAWTSDDLPQPRAAHGLLVEWAWEAVKDAVSPAGLGDWGETFEPLREPDTTLAKAVGHVAEETVDADGWVIRRFRHRTLLEHLVAEHIAGLSPKKAAQVLLPHLWFDPDWDVVAPAAIAAHPKRSKVLKLVLDQASSRRTDEAHSTAADELDRHLLRVAAESNPEDWTQDLRSRLSEVRVAHALDEPGLVARSSHWKLSNQTVLPKLLAALPGAAPWHVRALVAALPGLVDGEGERGKARGAILTALSRADGRNSDVLVAAVRDLVRSEAEWAKVREEIPAAFPDVDPGAVDGVVAALSFLGGGEAERIMVSDEILTTFHDKERARVREHTPGADLSIDFVLIAAFSGVGDGEVERAKVRKEIFAAFPGANLLTLQGFLMPALVSLVHSEAERATVRKEILAALSGVDRMVVPVLLTALCVLGGDNVEWVKVRGEIFAALPEADPGVIPSLVTILSFPRLEEIEQAKVCKEILTALRRADPGDVSALVAALTGLRPDKAERAKARDAILKVIADCGISEDTLVRSLRALSTAPQWFGWLRQE